MPFILLPTFVNGAGPYDFVLDTGASRTTLTTSLAREVHVEPTEAKEARGVGSGRMAAWIGVAREISVGDTVVRNVDVGIVDALPKCTGGTGVLGYTFLRHCLTAIDYPRGRLAFHELPGGVPRELLGGSRIALRLASLARPIPLVAPRMADGLESTFLLDTGASSTVISPRLAARLGLAERAGGSVVGTAGELAARAADLPSLRLGEWQIEDLAVQVVDAFGPLSEAVGETVDGVLGYDVLSCFRVGLDYENGFLYLTE